MTATTTEVDKHRDSTIPFWGAVVAVAGMAIGAFGPWVTALGMSASGTDGSNDGWAVVAACAVALIALLAYRRNPGRGKALWCLLAAVASSIVAIHDRIRVSSYIHQGPAFVQGLAQVGWGLNLAMVASIGLGIAALVLLRTTSPKSRKTSVAPA